MASQPSRKQDASFARRLVALRESAGLSVAQLAIQAQMSRTHLHNLESGVRKPALETARRLARAMGKSLAEFD